MSGETTSSRDGHASGSHYQPSTAGRSHHRFALRRRYIPDGAGHVACVEHHHHHDNNSTTTTTTPASTRVIKSRTRVQVANGTNVTALAATYTQRLMTQDWDTLPPANGPPEAKTIIYYRAGQVAAAREIAATIGVSQSSIHPLGHLTPVAGASGDDVIVILGNNSAPK